jgi:hypothetical protein
VLGGVPDPEHGLGAGDERGEEIAPGEAAVLGDREGRREHGRARMGAAVGLGQAVSEPRMLLLPAALVRRAWAMIILLHGSSAP